MALAAFVLPDRWLPRLPEIAEDRLAVVRQERARLLEAAREARPADHSAEEQRVLGDFVRAFLPMASELAPEFFDAVQEAINAGLRELLAKGRDTDTERLLAIRHLEHAVNTFGVLVESWAPVLRSLPQASLRLLMDLLSKAALGSPPPPLPEEARVVLRFELDLMVAIECLDGSLDDLTYWAHRAVAGARKVDAMPSPKLPPGWRGELARFRTKSSWSDWDEDEVRKELEPWPDESR